MLNVDTSNVIRLADYRPPVPDAFDMLVNDWLHAPQPDRIGFDDETWDVYLDMMFTFATFTQDEQQIYLESMLAQLKGVGTENVYGKILTHPALMRPFAVVNGEFDEETTNLDVFFAYHFYNPPISCEADDYCIEHYGMSVLEWITGY